jgi:hypothetical protein
MSGRLDVVARLTAAADDANLEALAFRPDDRESVRAAIAAVQLEPDRLADVERLALRVRSGIGLLGDAAIGFDDPVAASEWGGKGVLPMLAFLAMADDVRAFHRIRGISRELSNRALADIGQQTWVHRRTFGSFGMHTYEWVVTSFTGDLYWLGRLQFNLVQRPDGWLVSTHIPETGPLTPESVDDSFRQAVAFFAEHFPDYPTTMLHCGSWLLDPQLAEVLPDTSNMVRFQRRWTLEGEIGPADADAVFFVFRRRGEVDLTTLPQETTLQRAIVDKLQSGGHWAAWNGVIPQAAVA